jgi:ubiquinone/menaquinone biosynthesis C-methylase UbiE
MDGAKIGANCVLGQNVMVANGASVGNGYRQGDVTDLPFPDATFSGVMAFGLFHIRPHGGSRDYWDRRWTNAPVDGGALNLTKYPAEFAQAVADYTDGPLLEAGCGLGRIVIHFHNLGRDIIGIDYIQTAIDKILAARPDLTVRQADVMNLPFDDEAFGGVMAFGIYHSLESGVPEALVGTMRVLAPGDLLVANARLDNIQNRMNDRIEAKKYQGEGRSFYKANYTEGEFRNLLTEAGFETIKWNMLKVC